VEVLIFFKGLGLALVIVSLLSGVGYWVVFMIKKIKPDFKYWFKYNVLRRPVSVENTDAVWKINQSFGDISERDLIKELLLTNTILIGEIEELMFIRKQMKGGLKRNE